MSLDQSGTDPRQRWRMTPEERGQEAFMPDMPWPFGYRLRTYRLAAVVVVLVGIPTIAINWSDTGPWRAIGIFAAHAYIGLTIALLFPYLQRRIREKRTVPK